MTIIVYFSACAIVFALQCSSSLSAAETGFFQSKPPSCAAKFELTDVHGQRHTLADLRGQPAVVHFFATWCEPCKIEFASLRAFAERRSGQVRVLAINVGEVPGRVRRFLQETPVSFPVVLDADRAVAKSWGIEGLPSTVILDDTLTPRLAVTGDLDWGNTAVGAEIDRALADKSVAQRPKSENIDSGSEDHDCEQT